jgi:hypothetical protein
MKGERGGPSKLRLGGGAKTTSSGEGFPDPNAPYKTFTIDKGLRSLNNAPCVTRWGTQN